MILQHKLGLVLLLVGLTRGEEYVTRQRREYIEGGGGSGGGGGGGEVVGDLHSGEHCVDVSFWGNVTYDFDNEVCCDTVMQKQCGDKTKKVCGTVTNLECDILAYTECDLVMTQQEFTTDKMAEEEYQVWECDEGVKNVTHLKKLPECKNVTRQNCVQLWETDRFGKKVKKNVDCKPVTWQECKLVDIYKNLEVPDVNCYRSKTVPYNTCKKDVPQDFMVTKLVCRVKQAVTCVPKTMEKCTTVRYRECEEKPSRDCKPKRVNKPKQEYIHQEVCLLGGDKGTTHLRGSGTVSRGSSSRIGGGLPVTLGSVSHGGSHSGGHGGGHHYSSLAELKNQG